MHHRTYAAMLISCLLTLQPAFGQEPNTWTKLDKAVIDGRRWDVPIGYAPDLKRFLVLGGRITYADAKKPRSYDQLALDRNEGRWENWFPQGKDWGPKFGPCQPPAWGNESWKIKDAEGKARPNWTVYGTFSLGQKYDYDPDSKSFVFYAGGKTLRYDPSARQWTDLAPPNHPEKELGGILLWSSMCYDRHNHRFLLFGGGNVQSPRGDPGTWSYDPARNAWAPFKLDAQPTQRANSRLCYDPVNKKVVLFGGDRLDQLLADTWTFDVVTQEWKQCKPAHAPVPRAGHALLWLPKSKKVLLLGGYGYTSATGYVESLYRRLPLEAWVFDVAKERWDLIQRFDEGALTPKKGAEKVPQGPANIFLSAAVDDDDNVLVLGTNGTWLCRFDASKVDATGTAKHGVAAGTVDRRTGPHDPAWYKIGVPEPTPAKVAEDLKALPKNQWVVRPTPKLPRPNMDWGSAVFAPELDMILRFSGGHSAYSGTAPQVYDVKTDRYTIPFAPEYPIEYVYSNDQVHGEWSFQGNPWMSGHTYKATGYDPHLQCLVFAAHDYTYFFDPKLGKWTRNDERCPFRPNMYVVTLCATPEGVVCWADQRNGGAGLWRLDAKSRTWKSLPLSGSLPGKSPDQHGMAYDSKRDRLLFFSNADNNRGNVAMYDFRTGKANWLDAIDKEKAAVPSRETVYLPELDAVLVGARVNVGGKQLWALYDCGKNAWFGAELPGADPIGKGTQANTFNNSMGLMYDPNRKLVWAVGQNSHVHVLSLDRAKLKVTSLSK
ncbi:MAG TPA: kelch repeat-containing protein [Gemmataceae bacterium]|nr:kelch repeat-containing protein [Gemmataceae bacterium]